MSYVDGALRDAERRAAEKAPPPRIRWVAHPDWPALYRVALRDDPHHGMLVVGTVCDEVIGEGGLPWSGWGAESGACGWCLGSMREDDRRVAAGRCDVIEDAERALLRAAEGCGWHGIRGDGAMLWVDDAGTVEARA